MTLPGTPIAKYPRVLEQQLVMIDVYSKMTSTPVMAIAFIRSVQAGRLDSEWIQHRVINYVNQLAYAEQARAKKRAREAKKKEQDAKKEEASKASKS